MLNALRHQRFRHIIFIYVDRPYKSCSTPYGIKGSGTGKEVWRSMPMCSAQRLTASKVPAPTWSGTNVNTLDGAQRLTASKVPALFRFGGCACSGIVLNALRHQRFRHDPDGSESVSAIVQVLNALRHQRFRHGIALGSTFNHVSAQRLTASKVPAHSLAEGLRRERLCSTPYGIKGSGTAI